MARSRVPGRRAQALLDTVLLAWAVLWVVVGIAVAHQVRGLAEMSDTVAGVGRATTTLGQTIRSLPIVGGSLDEPAGEITAAGRQAVASAQSARAHARSVGTLLGLSIALIPSLPVLMLYVPGRIAGGRERRALARAVARGREPWIDEVLARRALVHLPYRRLRELSDDPIADLRSGRHAALAAAELEWFGVDGHAPVSR
jgi:hypothetical protein